MKQIAYIVCLMVLFACGDKEQEVIDINDVIPSSENYKNGHDAEDTSEQNLPVFSPSIDPSLQVEPKQFIQFKKALVVLIESRKLQRL